MRTKRHVKTSEVVAFTGCAYEDVLGLIKTGVLQGYKNRRGHWRLNVDSVERHFGIKINNDVQEKATRLVINDSHYDEVVKRICNAKSSIKILTANFKRFRLKPTAKQGVYYNDGTPFIEYLMNKAVHGVSVQIICSNPSDSFTKEWQEYYQQMGNPDLFEYKFSDRNHAKVYIIDDEIAYIGSANVTKAGIRQLTPGNYEAGILTDDPELVSSVKEFFFTIWDANS